MSDELLSGVNRHAIAAFVHLVFTGVIFPVSDSTNVLTVQLHAAVGLYTGLSHAVQAWLLEGKPVTRPWAPRWSEYAVTAPVMSAASYVSAGGDNEFLLLSVMVTQSVLQVFGFFIESGGPRVRLWFFGGFLLNAYSSGLILQQALTNDNDTEEIVASAIYSASFATFPLLALLDTKRNLDPEELDTLYVLLSVTSKITMLSVVIGLELDWALDTILGVGAPTIFVLFFLIGKLIGIV